MNNRRLYCFNRLQELLGEAWDGCLALGFGDLSYGHGFFHVFFLSIFTFDF
jgi:hypothetical protein